MDKLQYDEEKGETLIDGETKYTFNVWRGEKPLSPFKIVSTKEGMQMQGAPSPLLTEDGDLQLWAIVTSKAWGRHKVLSRAKILSVQPKQLILPGVLQ